MMKTPLSYFLLALTAFSVATIGSGQGPVLDMDGDAIFTGSYYVIPFLRGQGGGVTLAPHAGNYPCPLDIIQKSSEMDKGLPVKFSNWRSKVGFVPVNSTLNIETEVAATMCAQPTYWWVDWVIVEEEEKIILTETHYLTAGPDPKEYKGDYLMLSVFQIEEAGDKNVYKIVFCPGDLPRNAKLSESSCGYVGIIVDRFGVRRLAFTDSNPLLVEFKKAEVIESTVLTKNIL